MTMTMSTIACACGSSVVIDARHWNALELVGWRAGGRASSLTTCPLGAAGRKNNRQRGATADADAGNAGEQDS